MDFLPFKGIQLIFQEEENSNTSFSKKKTHFIRDTQASVSNLIILTFEKLLESNDWLERNQTERTSNACDDPKSIEM